MPIAPVVAERAEEIRQICRRHGVKRLDLFGSAARDDFEPASDVDFLVDFHSGPGYPGAPPYFELLQALEQLFDQDVDLVMETAISNPYFRRSVEEDRTPLYEA